MVYDTVYIVNIKTDQNLVLYIILWYNNASFCQFKEIIIIKVQMGQFWNQLYCKCLSDLVGIIGVIINVFLVVNEKLGNVFGYQSKIKLFIQAVNAMIQ